MRTDKVGKAKLGFDFVVHISVSLEISFDLFEYPKVHLWAALKKSVQEASKKVNL